MPQPFSASFGRCQGLCGPRYPAISFSIVSLITGSLLASTPAPRITYLRRIRRRISAPAHQFLYTFRVRQDKSQAHSLKRRQIAPIRLQFHARNSQRLDRAEIMPVRFVVLRIAKACVHSALFQRGRYDQRITVLRSGVNPVAQRALRQVARADSMRS